MKVQQQIRGTTDTVDSTVLPMGTIQIDTDLMQIRLHNGVTPGGVVFMNGEQIVSTGTLEFTSNVAYNTPGIMPASVVGKRVTINTPGDYELPLITEFPTGSRIVISTTQLGVTLGTEGTETISDQGVAVTMIAMEQHKVYTLARQSTSQWLMCSAY